MPESVVITLSAAGVALVLGLVLSPILRAQWYQMRHRKRDAGEFQVIQASPEVRASIWAFILLSAIIAGLSWFAYYYIQEHNLSPLLGQLATTIFGFAAAGLIGQVVFELLLRKQLLDQTSQVLADVMLMRKGTLQAIFSRKRIHEIVRLCLGILSENPDAGVHNPSAFGDQLFQRVQEQIEDTKLRPLRVGFTDDIVFSSISEREHEPELDAYFAVLDNLSFETRLPYPFFRAAIARDTDQLYKLFNDPTCIYRWLMTANQTVFERLLKHPEYFDVQVELGDGDRDKIPCEIVREQTGLTDRGYEIVFKHPVLRAEVSSGFTQKPERITVNASTLHSKSEHLVSVHLAYPVDSVTISLVSRQDAFTKIEGLTFFYGRNPKPERIGDAGLRYRIQGNRWIMPGEGVVFFWE